MAIPPVAMGVRLPPSPLRGEVVKRQDTTGMNGRHQRSPKPHDIAQRKSNGLSNRWFRVQIPVSHWAGEKGISPALSVPG